MTKITWLRTTLVTLALGTGALLGGCERTERAAHRVDYRVERGANEVREEARGGGPVMPAATAVGRIAEARCARETRCNNVGQGRRFANGGACINNARADRSESLNATDCPAGIDQRELEECLQAIQAEDCSNPLDSLSRVVACRSSDLCLHTTPNANH